jgi:hypothetical protein
MFSALTALMKWTAQHRWPKVVALGILAGWVTFWFRDYHVDLGPGLVSAAPAEPMLGNVNREAKSSSLIDYSATATKRVRQAFEDLERSKNFSLPSHFEIGPPKSKIHGPKTSPLRHYIADVTPLKLMSLAQILQRRVCDPVYDWPDVCNMPDEDRRKIIIKRPSLSEPVP